MQGHRTTSGGDNSISSLFVPIKVNLRAIVSRCPLRVAMSHYAMLHCGERSTAVLDVAAVASGDSASNGDQAAREQEPMQRDDDAKRGFRLGMATFNKPAVQEQRL